MSLHNKKLLLVGNPNTGKSTLFNTLTGLKQKVSNYPGVTVEKKSGFFTHENCTIELLDLPGTYSLIASSPDEAIATQHILGKSTQNFDGVIVVADSTNMERNLFLLTQVVDCGWPVYLVLNMSDELARQGMSIQTKILAEKLGIPVFLVSAQDASTLQSFKNALIEPALATPALLAEKIKLPGSVQSILEPLTKLLQNQGLRGSLAEALRIVTREDSLEEYAETIRPQLLREQKIAQEKLTELKYDWRALESELRFNWIAELVESTVKKQSEQRITFSDRLDKMLLHHLFGPALFVVLMGVIFQAIFSWSSAPMDLIDTGMQVLSSAVGGMLPESLFKSFVVDGVLAGVGSVVIFVPQIAILFFFICILEDSGYLSRASFVMDKLMRKLGLHGKAFIPLMSSFACAIPGIMATRTIESKRDRLITMLIAPLMSCTARLPVYTLLIAACIPAFQLFGLINVQGMVMWGLYLAGVIVALGVSWLLKKTMLKSPSLPLLIELPPYRVPQWDVTLKKTFERAWLFVKNAGTVIFTLSLALWLLMSFPKAPEMMQDGSTPPTQLEYSFAGRLGKTIEPLIEPLGFDWKIGVGLVASFAAREVFVSTMAIMYRLDDADETSPSLIEQIQHDTRADGSKLFTPLTGISLLLFFVFACQCMSTVAVVKRETQGWRWPLFMLAYMTLLAYTISLVVYQGGLILGWH